MSRHTSLLLLLLASAVAQAEGRFAFTQADRVEYQSNPEAYVWDLQGWYGGDINRLWWKAEGERENGDDSDYELQLLYSRAISAYFDLQLGARYEHEAEDASLVVGIQGLAPYRFEVDAAAYVTEQGDVFLRGEFERDLLLTQRLVLQPRLELEASVQDVAERAVSSGFTDAALEMRLRYDVNRNFGPYVGVSWQRYFGDAARALRAAGEDDSLTTFVVGARFWF